MNIIQVQVDSEKLAIKKVKFSDISIEPLLDKVYTLYVIRDHYTPKLTHVRVVYSNGINDFLMIKEESIYTDFNEWVVKFHS